VETTPFEPASPEEDRSFIEEDVQPTIPLVETDELLIRLGGLVHLLTAGYAGDDSLVENRDPVTRAGFRLRRARVGFDATFRGSFGVLVAINLLETDEEIGTVSDAKFTYDAAPWARFEVGTGKVPFARGELESSRTLASIERPLSVSDIAPTRRLGASFQGEVLDRRLGYIAGVFNGTEGFVDGNQFGGFLTSGRLQYVVIGEPRGLDVVDGVAVGVSGFYEDAPATNGFAAAADLLVAFAGAKLVVEGLCDRRTPDDSPEIAPTLMDEIERCGVYATGSYQIPDLPLEPAARVELVDDNRNIDDAGDAWLMSLGVNSQLMSYARAQLHYIRRVERHGAALSNDQLVLSLMGAF
jgi:hypothetical protein